MTNTASCRLLWEFFNYWVKSCNNFHYIEHYLMATWVEVVAPDYLNLLVVACQTNGLLKMQNSGTGGKKLEATETQFDAES